MQSSAQLGSHSPQFPLPLIILHSKNIVHNGTLFSTINTMERQRCFQLGHTYPWVHTQTA
jgi:hypothetical protein